jgi:hypothetical protein
MIEQPATWDGLVEALNGWADTRQVEDGIEVTFTTSDGVRRTVQVVMTPDDWEELAWVIRGVSPETLQDRILALPDDVPFLVCDSGVELVASQTRELPSDSLDDFRPEPGGRWVVTDGVGHVLSEFGKDQDEEGLNLPLTPPSLACR